MAVALAATAVDCHVRGRRPPALEPTALPGTLNEPGASFVSLHARAELRGCVGSLGPVRPLAADIVANAVAAASRDPRFAPVRADELALLDVEVSVLSAEARLETGSWDHVAQAVRPGVDGVTVRCGDRRATLLPAVWEQLPEPVDFLSALWRKAGLAPGTWHPGTEIWCYTAERWGSDLLAALDTAPVRRPK